MTLPASSGNLIDNDDYNATQNNMEQILGLNDDGYGLPGFYSIPVTGWDRITTRQWNSLILDLGITYEHITGTTSTLAFVTTGTVISPGYHNTLYNTSTWVLDPVRRWTCHPSQFVLNTFTNTTTFFTTSSERTAVWGENTVTNSNIPTVSHQVVASWPTRSEAYYYFNQGAYLVWQPYHLNNGVNDLDTEWATFINELKNTGEPYRYGRNEYRNWPGGTSTVFLSASGGQQITVTGVVNADKTQVTLNIDFANLDTSLVTVAPGVGYWNFVV